MALTLLDQGTMTLDHTSLGIDSTILDTTGLSAVVLAVYAPCTSGQQARFQIADPDLYTYDYVPLWQATAVDTDELTQQILSPPVPVPTGGRVRAAQMAGSVDVTVYWRVYTL